jgi:cation:H+ antiporter
MIYEIGLFLFGFLFVIKGADYLIEGASSLAKRFNISNLVIGLTIVSFGTSLPELVVNVAASLNGSSDLLIGNILGSNISNILLILGTAAIMQKITLKHGTVYHEIPLSLLAAVVVLFLANDYLIDGATDSALTRSDGLILLCFFMVFMYYVYSINKNSKSELKQDSISALPLPHSAGYICAGIFGLFIGGQWVVDGALFIAKTVGISESVVGLSIVALGTSLPELVTSIMASFKKNADMAIGNIVGSNIFNILFVLGISAIIAPIPFQITLDVEVIFLISASILVFLMAAAYRKPLVLERFEGVLLVCLYFAYIVYLFLSSGLMF